MFILTYDADTKICGGFYKKGMHNNIPTPNIFIDKKLYSRLLGDKFKIKDEIQIDPRIYTLEDFDIFELVHQEQPKSTPSIIEKEVAQMALDLVNKDLQIKELETQQAQSLLELAEKDLKIKNLENDMANIILQISIGGIKQ
ncbi:MAG: hypothetical protein E7C86_03800 [Paeniclostridium sordellii]|nr:hypothetical protein [Paeniclostridium sordellii]